MADDSFQQWMQQQSAGVQAQKKEFQEYKDKRDKEFTAFLKAQWKAVDIVEGEVLDEEPKPITMPVAPVPVVAPDSKQLDKKPVSVNKPKPVVITTPKAAPIVVARKGQRVQIDFYGRPVSFYFDRKLRHDVSGTINKEAVSEYWSTLSRADYDDLTKQLSAQKKSLQLNDWAFAALINKLAYKISNKRKNETALLSWFLLTKSGYKSRVAYNRSNIFLLVPSQQELFEVPYFTFSNKRYYAVEFDGKKQQLGTVYTYDGEYPNTDTIFDMHITPVVASNDRDERRQLVFNFEGKRYTIEAVYDRGRIKFFSTYPQLNLDMYFGSSVYENTATPLQKQLAAHIEGMDELRAVNFLLRFVQTSLKYETDDQQFGEENYLFPEETLFYPYSDCEDRAILFAWLVKSLLDLDVVGLDYPGHVAAAVKFSEPVVGDGLNYKGSRYVVTDPTYINANAGMTMPDFKQHRPTVISF